HISRPSPRRTRFPYTTLFRSGQGFEHARILPCEDWRMLTVAAIAAYLLATGLLLADLRREPPERWTWLAATGVAVLLHGSVHLLAWRATGGTDMHFFAALSLVGLGMAALTALFGAGARMAALGVVVYPLAALLLAGYALYGHRIAEPLDWRLQLHAWSALLSYATLAIAALLAVMLWLQE